MGRIVLAAAALALMAAPLLAQESTEDLRRELESMKKKMDGMESRLAQYESREIPGPAQGGPDAMAADGDSPLMTLLKESKISGDVDSTYMWAVNAPTAGGVLPGRSFDNNPNSFYLSSARLQLERLADEKMIVGYHMELAAGHDPFVYDGSTVSLQEGWVQMIFPIASVIDIRVGKMATLAGFEVIEAKDDMNISRGFLFSLAIPFTHTGVRAAYISGDTIKFTLGVNNGWNTTSVASVTPGLSISAPELTYVDRDYGKTLEFQAALTPSKDIGVYLTIYFGDESTNYGTGPGSGLYSKRYVIDVVTSYTLDQLTLALQFDFGSQQDAVIAGRSGWSGIAVFARYAVSQLFAAAVRIEYLSDQNGGLGFDSGFDGIGPVPFEGGAGSRLCDVTLTLETKVASQLILRIEVRSDNSNDHVFFRGSSGAKGQTTFGAQAIMPF